jgi:hypothetical protein
MFYVPAKSVNVIFVELTILLYLFQSTKWQNLDIDQETSGIVVVVRYYYDVLCFSKSVSSILVWNSQSS